MGRADAYPIDRYLDASRTLSLNEYDWSRATRDPLSPDFERALVYMLRIEAQTLFYVRDLLNTRTAYIPEISSFLSVWLYEEERHSRIFKRFLRERGILIPDDDREKVRRASIANAREWVEAEFAKWMARSTEHFVAVHMVWGAYQEISTIHAYERVGERSNHPFLKELCDSIAKDERRHFAFYFNQAARFLAPRPAQLITRGLLKTWWKPVGFGIHKAEHAQFFVDWIFGDEEGQARLRGMDATIGRLPGLDGLTLFEDAGITAKRVVRERRARGLGFDDWVTTHVPDARSATSESMDYLETTTA
jgi:rubrerythrin